MNGQRHNIKKPLDFCAVSDHAEFIARCIRRRSRARLAATTRCSWSCALKSIDEQRKWFVKYVINNMRGENRATRRFTRSETTKSAWKDVMLKAARTLPAGRSPRSRDSSGQPEGSGTCTAT